jgi:superfamily I DNA/RNA helicase
MQKILVGDSAQAIYSWRGAVDAFSYLGCDETTYLTQSFRFGDEVARIANLCLTELDSPMQVKGLGSIPSTIEMLEEPDAILTRTNGRAVSLVLQAQQRGKTPYLMGGAQTVVAFARAAADLMVGKSPHHADLSCFDSWQEVIDYVASDPQGDELAQMVKLVEDYGVETIVDALGKMPRSEDRCDLVVSTAHKSKGREWETVKLADDFTGPDGDERPSPAELRLLYVAVTRAKLVLDPFSAEIVADLMEREVVA